jgi:FAD/FMN-containing dehydrogenase
MDTKKIPDLKAVISGTVALPGDEVYEKASKMLFRTITPGVVVRPESSEDVAAAIRFAKAHNVPFAIRSGGHSNIASRLADGILLIDMRGLASTEVIDSDKGLVRVGAGALWREVASELEKHGLGISSGDTGSVGVGGLSTGAGIGWMVRKYGPIVDNTVAAEVVTADGSIVEASEDESPDLFWAIRGGGSNFGVVTYFTFKAHPVKGVFFGSIAYPMENAGAVIKGWRDAMRQAPPELTTMLLTLPSFGDDAASISITGCFEGTDKAAADEAFAPFLNLGKLVHQDIRAMPYKDVLGEAHLSPNTRVIGHTTFLKEFTNEAIEIINKLCQGTPPILQIRHVAGVMNKRAADATAFSHRDCEVLIVNPTFVSPDASEADIRKALTPWRTIKPLGEGPYLNLLSEDTGKEITEAYPPATLQRLRKIKAQYDPDNILNANYNIPPEA